MFGATGVGKSSLTIRTITDQFIEDYDPTIEDSYRKAMTCNGKAVLLDILDTYDGDEYIHGGYRDLWIKESNHFMLVYDIRSLKSFERAKEFYHKILRTKEEQNINVVLVANKCDLYDPSFGDQAMMKLNTQNIQDLVYGYVRDGQQLCRNYTSIIPEDVKAICMSYHGEPMYIEVTKEMGKELTELWGDCDYKVTFIETSAKTGHNVHQAFESFVILSDNAIDS